jgi:F420-dependent oxidoreductase-like protein
LLGVSPEMDTYYDTDRQKKRILHNVAVRQAERRNDNMVAISIMIEGQMGLTWEHWKKLVTEVETAGFAGLFRSDHFTNPQPPDRDSLEMIVTQTYLADRTQRIHFGPLVAPLSFREPTLLARQAAAIDDLSGGRFILGLGAGWQEREHRLFGHTLGSVSERMQRLEEGIEVITQLLKSDEPVTFEGKFFQLHGATLLPRPQRPGGPDILVGGNGVKRILPLAARYATYWNAVNLTPEAFQERSITLDRLLQERGRRTSEVKHTLMLNLFFGRDRNELDQKLGWRHNQEELAGSSVEDAVEKIQRSGSALVGTADKIIEQIKAYEQAGVEEIMLQWFDLTETERLRAFAQQVITQVQ